MIIDGNEPRKIDTMWYKNQKNMNIYLFTSMNEQKNFIRQKTIVISTHIRFRRIINNKYYGVKIQMDESLLLGSRYYKLAIIGIGDSTIDAFKF